MTVTSHMDELIKVYRGQLHRSSAFHTQLFAFADNLLNDEYGVMVDLTSTFTPGRFSLRLGDQVSIVGDLDELYQLVRKMRVLINDAMPEEDQEDL